MIQFLQSKWMTVIAGTLTFVITTWFCLQPLKQIQKAVAAKGIQGSNSPALPPNGPSWTFFNPELSQLVSDLKGEREALRIRSNQLDELEVRLNAERQEIFSVTQAVHLLRVDLDKSVTHISEEEAVNLKKVVKVYATMTPEGAARILKEMDDTQVVRILTSMKESLSAPILESFGQGAKDDAQRAATISNRLRLTLSATKKPATP